MSDSVTDAKALADRLELRARKTLSYIRNYVMTKPFTLADLGNHLGRSRKKKAVENDLLRLEKMGLISIGEDGFMLVTPKGWT